MLLKNFISVCSCVVMFVEYFVDDITGSSRFHVKLYERYSLFCKCVKL